MRKRSHTKRSHTKRSHTKRSHTKRSHTKRSHTKRRYRKLKGGNDDIEKCVKEACKEFDDDRIPPPTKDEMEEIIRSVKNGKNFEFELRKLAADKGYNLIQYDKAQKCYADHIQKCQTA